MSPLLYQLSYTAAAAKLTACGGRVKRSVPIVPATVPAGEFARRVLEIGRGDDIVAVEHGARPMAGDAHAHDFRHA